MRTRHVSSRIGPALLGAALLLALPAGGCGESDRIVYDGGALFRAQGDRFEINTGSGWRSFFAKGVNLGVATPGKYPGELNQSRADYDRWLGLMADMHCNVVRLYTLHYPVFYQALGEWNQKHPSQPIYLVQGIWLDEFEHGDYITGSTQQLDEEIRYVIDAVHGNADVPTRYGKAHGTYRHDVSRWVMAYLPGHEMDGNFVAASNHAWYNYTRYDGHFISSPPGLPIEAWVARAMDHVVAYERAEYDQQHPVGWSNWPTLDPMHHPTETVTFAQDRVSPNFGRFKVDPRHQAGIFVSYHVYPFYPEFIIYDPVYTTTRDRRGKLNSYLGYLKDLKASHRGIPLFITEFGVPSSMGVAHRNPTARDHGGYTEAEQSQVTVELVEDIVDAGGAGVVVFELLEEWFKSSWMNKPTNIPKDRGRLWFDRIDPEEHFGLVSFYPVPGLSKTIDGKGDDWSAQERLVAQSGVPVAPANDGRDFARTIRAMFLASDPAYLFVRLDINTTALADLDETVWVVGLSTLPGKTGDRSLPEVGVKAPDGMGFEAAIVLDKKNKKFELRTDKEYDPTAKMNGTSKTGGRPEYNDNGQYVVSNYIVNNDLQYKAEKKNVDVKVLYYAPGQLKQGSQITDSNTHFELGTSGVIEIRIPWSALWVADPSSLMVLDDNPLTNGFEATKTSGIHAVAVAARRDAAGKLTVVDAAPRASYSAGVFSASGIPLYTWKGWDSITSKERIKHVYYMLQNAFKKL